MSNWKLADQDLSGFLGDLRRACSGAEYPDAPPAWLSDEASWRDAARGLRRRVLRRLCESRRLTRAYEQWKLSAEQLRLRSRVQRGMGLDELADRTALWADRFWDRALRAAALAFERETRAKNVWQDSGGRSSGTREA